MGNDARKKTRDIFKGKDLNELNNQVGYIEILISKARHLNNYTLILELNNLKVQALQKNNPKKVVNSIDRKISEMQDLIKKLQNIKTK